MGVAQVNAQSVPPTPTLPGSSLKALAGTSGLPSFEEMQAGLSRYQGATAAFSQTYATLSSQPLDAWLASNGATLSATLGVPAITGSLQTPLDLQAFLANSGFAAQLKSWGTSSQDVMRDPISANIVNGSMGFASSFATMRMPDTKALTSSLSTAGLFSERAVTALATDFPDLIGQVRASGKLSPAAMSAWQTSMRNAAAASLPNAADGLIDKCQAGLLWAMGSGSATGAKALTGNSCGACIAQGLYMHSGFTNMLNTEVKSSVIPPSDFNQLPAWRRAAIATSNPAVTATPNFTAQGSGCTSSSAAANTVLSGTLTGLDK
jgi:uncharacterized protein YidB (DUF937 family)